MITIKEATIMGLRLTIGPLALAPTHQEARVVVANISAGQAPCLGWCSLGLAVPVASVKAPKKSRSAPCMLTVPSPSRKVVRSVAQPGQQDTSMGPILHGRCAKDY
ncbi:hypothetical protein BG003_005631 [Podila horticola]|nr:hypothetical protein BG003_005631 [Podila horticola]